MGRRAVPGTESCVVGPNPTRGMPEPVEREAAMVGHARGTRSPAPVRSRRCSTLLFGPAREPDMEPQPVPKQEPRPSPKLGLGEDGKYRFR
jgi:hypothetical protein